jgi:hypothetical protein
MGTKPKAGHDLQKDRGNGEAKKQSERFIETARALGVDETGKEFERTLAKVAPARNPKKAG